MNQEYSRKPSVHNFNQKQIYNSLLYYSIKTINLPKHCQNYSLMVPMTKAQQNQSKFTLRKNKKIQNNSINQNQLQNFFNENPHQSYVEFSFQEEQQRFQQAKINSRAENLINQSKEVVKGQLYLLPINRGSIFRIFVADQFTQKCVLYSQFPLQKLVKYPKTKQQIQVDLVPFKAIVLEQEPIKQGYVVLNTFCADENFGNLDIVQLQATFKTMPKQSQTFKPQLRIRYKQNPSLIQWKTFQQNCTIERGTIIWTSNFTIPIKILPQKLLIEIYDYEKQETMGLAQIDFLAPRIMMPNLGNSNKSRSASVTINGGKLQKLNFFYLYRMDFGSDQ